MVVVLVITCLSLGFLSSRRPYKHWTTLLLKAMEYIATIVVVFLGFLSREKVLNSLDDGNLGLIMLLIAGTVPALMPVLLVLFWYVAFHQNL